MVEVLFAQTVALLPPIRATLVEGQRSLSASHWTDLGPAAASVGPNSFWYGNAASR